MPKCKDCNGSKFFTGMFSQENCRRCQGSGEEPQKKIDIPEPSNPWQLPPFLQWEKGLSSWWIIGDIGSVFVNFYIYVGPCSGSIISSYISGRYKFDSSQEYNNLCDLVKKRNAVEPINS